MSKKCVAFSKSKLGLETADNRKSFYAGWDAALAEQAENEPIRFIWNGEGWIEADDYIWKTTDDHERRILYAAPVRTKDLSDDEIADALYGKGCWRLGVHPDHLREYRRVIQADRELNK